LREALSKAANSDQFKTALANLGQELDYMDEPEFAKFWEADTKRIEAAIRSIGKVE
jgi:tripartite-type tricarboxylate transporter receptor subunit TctC